MFHGLSYVLLGVWRTFSSSQGVSEEYLEVSGAFHGFQRVPMFNDLLVSFIGRNKGMRFQFFQLALIAVLLLLCQNI